MVRDPGTQPSADVPSFSVRWEGLVVVLDTLTVNAILKRVTARVPEVREASVEAEDGRLGLTIRIKKGVTVPAKAYLSSFRLKDGFLGFHVSKLTAFGFLPVPDWILVRIVQRLPAGFAFYYPGARVFVVNLTSVLPAELSLQIRQVVCEGGEIRAYFGPSQYRLDKLIDEIGRDPFQDE